MNNPVVIGVVLAYFVLMFAIGAWANTKMKSAKEFLVAGQSLGFFVMAIASFSSIQSGWGMVGGTGQTYSWGLQALIAVGLFAPFGFAAAWFLLGSRLNWIGKRHHIFSVPDLIRVRFQDRTSHATMSVAVFIASVAYMTAQVTSIGVIISLLLGTSVSTSAWIGSLVVASYTMAGGMLAAVWTDLIQGVLMVIMSVGLFIFAVQVAGGWAPMLETISSTSAELLAIDGVKSPTYIFAFGLLIFVGAVGQPQLLTKFLMLRDITQLKWGAAVAGIAYAITTLFSVGIGLATRSMTITGDAPELENIDDTAIWFLDSVTNPIVGGIALTGLLAAIMSSASSFITIGASSMMRDLPTAFGITVRRELLWSRVSSLVLVVLSVLLTLFLSQVVFLLGALGWAAFAAAIVGPVVMSIYWTRATGTAATVTVVFAILGNLVITSLAARDIISVPAFMQIGGISLLVSILLFYVVSLVTSNRHPDATLDHLYASGADSASGADGARGTDSAAGIGSVVGAAAGAGSARGTTAIVGTGSDHRRGGAMVHAFAAVSALALAGMLTDTWQIVFLSVPVFAVVMMLQGSLRHDGTWDRVSTMAIVAYCAVLAVLVVWSVATAGGDAMLWGLPMSMAVIFYLIWPYTAAVAGFLYAFVFDRTLKGELVGGPLAAEPATASDTQAAAAPATPRD